jgi:AcrR family transcriptional regulator
MGLRGPLRSQPSIETDRCDPLTATVPQITLVDPPDKPLRKDAERNRRRILDAARELFAQRGLGVTLNDIAHHAGVGVGTVYRRFPDKDVLIESLFEESMGEIAALMQQALTDPDPWHGLVWFLSQTATKQSADAGLKELVTDPSAGTARIARIRDRMMPMTEELFGRARRAGRLRDDITALDIPMLQLMVGSLIDAARDVDPDLWRRYLAVLVRGLATRPQDEPPLPVPAPGAGAVDQVMTRYKRA